MLAKIVPAPIVGFIALLFHTLNTFFWFVPIFSVALVKLFIPFKLVSSTCNNLLNFFATSWISVNTQIHRLTKPIHWDLSIPAELSQKQWYLVIANHQSWVDILALQHAFNQRIPFLKFFLKQELIWVPVLGLAWWALDFPFMKRYSKSYLRKNPSKKGKDFETTRKACEKFKSIPISVMNFTEGTRFTIEKSEKQNSPFKNLLKPKSGGIGYVLTLMGNNIHQIIDVTIDYPNNSQFSFWDFLCGRVKTIRIKARVLPVPENIKGNYIENSDTRRETQRWINQLWSEKDHQLSRLNDDGSTS